MSGDGYVFSFFSIDRRRPWCDDGETGVTLLRGEREKPTEAEERKPVPTFAAASDA